jgi:hypothetical protein
MSTTNESNEYQDLLNFYMNAYNQTEQRITHLYSTLDNLREAIERIYNARRRNVNRPLSQTYNVFPRQRRLQQGVPENQNQYFTFWYDHFFDNVPVVPTAQQIADATRSTTYSDIENPLNDSCPISMERFQPNSTVTEIVYCHHLFHPESLQSWFQTSVRCPVCRYDIRQQAQTQQQQQQQAPEQNVPLREDVRPTTATQQIEDLLHSFIHNPNFFSDIPVSTTTRVYDFSLNGLFFR